MIHIEKIKMTLPAGFQHRATTIAYLIGQILAEKNISDDIFIKNITVNNDMFSLEASDDQLAETIVDKILASYVRRML